MTTYSYPDFLRDHAGILTSACVPKHLWESLHTKLLNQVYDAGKVFEMHRLHCVTDSDPEGGYYTWEVSTIVDSLDPEAPDSIYLIDHAWTFQVSNARSQLLSTPGLLQRVAILLDVVQPDVDPSALQDIGPQGNEEKTKDLIDKVMKFIWSSAHKYKVAVGEAAKSENGDTALVNDFATIWYLLDEFGSRIEHSSNDANVRLASFCYIPTGLCYSLLWPIRTLHAQDAITCDMIEHVKDPKLRQYLAVVWTCQDFTEEDLPPINLLTEEFFQHHVIGETVPPALTPDPKPPLPLRIYTDIDIIPGNIPTDSGTFVFVENEADADILWVYDHYKTYSELAANRPNTFINQFPHENVLTVKDLLAVIGAGRSWLPLTFNLVYHLPHFIAEFQSREADEVEEEGMRNVWIVKPWNRARGMGVLVTDNLDQIIRLCDDNTEPLIVSEYVRDQVVFYRDDLAFGVKFDIRYIILLHTVRPLKAFVYKTFWLRFANKEFSLDNFDDYEKHFTVMNYRNDSKLKQIHCEEFVPMFEKQNPDHSWADIEKGIHSMLRDILTAATDHPPPIGIATSPQSRAMYAVDLLLKWTTDSQGSKSIQPVVCEVNFCPDCTRACKYHPSFFSDVFSTLFLDKPKNMVSL